MALRTEQGVASRALVALTTALAGLGGGSAWADEGALAPAELRVIETRLAPVQPARRALALAAGDTAFIEARLQVPRARLQRPPTDYEGVLTGVATIDGVDLHGRVDDLRFLDRGEDVEVVYVYVVSVDPRTRTGGMVRARFSLRERVGLANTLAEETIVHRVTVVPPEPSPRDLAADFHGYRHYLARARRSLEILEQSGFRGLSIQDRGPVPPTDRLSRKGVAVLAEFEKARRRAWVAHRHLVAAARSGPPKLQGVARAFLKNLARPKDRWAGLPDIPLVDAPAPPPPDAPPAPESSRETEDGTLAPVAEYRAGSEGTLEDEPLASEPIQEDTREAGDPLAVAEAAPPPPTTELDPSEDPELMAISAGLEPVPVEPGEGEGVGKRFYLPSYPRSLLLDDPNIAHGGSVRASLAEVSRPEVATTVAVFYSAQVGLTRDLGLEVTVPTQLVDVDLGTEVDTSYNVGNPLVAAKYRLHLPTVVDRRPSLTLRARWGIAASQRNQIPASDYFVEDFSFDPNLTDTYAFLLEKTDIGVGGSLAWRWRWLHLGLQLYVDYFFPTDIATDRLDLLALGYGASVGALPFGETLGLYLETRAVSMIVGPRRTDIVVYGGARGRFLDFLEPALWVGAPVGSVADVSGVQIGAELRFSYDVRSIIELGGRRTSSGGAP